jgi:hypothetical protein
MAAEPPARTLPQPEHNSRESHRSFLSLIGIAAGQLRVASRPKVVALLLAFRHCLGVRHCEMCPGTGRKWKAHPCGWALQRGE